MSLGGIFTPSLIWFLIGIGLLLMELFVPAFIIFFFGLGCWVAAGVLLFVDLSLSAQILIFLVASLLCLLFLRRSLIQAFKGRSHSLDDPDYEDFPKGASVKVVKTIRANDRGRVLYRGTTWEAVAEVDIEEGENATIEGYADSDKMTFIVRKP